MGLSVLSEHCMMYRFAIFFTSVLIGASGKNLSRNGDDWVPSEEDLAKIINLVICACDDGEYDGQMSLDEYLSPKCEAIGFHIFEHENDEDDFGHVDANGDGFITFEEAFEAAMNVMPAGRKMPALRDFAEEQAVQAWAFGQSILDEYFQEIDQDGNGEIDEQEATDAINYAIQNDLLTGA